jgi:hypothetical protein
MELGARRGVGEERRCGASGHRRCRKSRSNRIGDEARGSERQVEAVFVAPAADTVSSQEHDARAERLAGGERSERIEHGCQRAGRINCPNGVEETLAGWLFCVDGFLEPIVQHHLCYTMTIRQLYDNPNRYSDLEAHELRRVVQ